MPVPYVLDNTLGAAFVGLVAASTLHGVSLVQAWYYYTHQNDLWRIKLLVAAVVTFDTIHQILITHTVYWYNVTNWGNPPALELIVWSMLVEVIFNGLTALLVQGFLTLRVWRLSNRHKLLTGVVVLLILGEFVAVVAYTAIGFQLKTYAELGKLESLSILVNALAAAGDVLIAAALCTLLHLSRTGFHRSDTMINKLMLFAVNTGVLTSVCAVASLISIVVAGKTFLYIAFFFCIGRLYTNSLLATLNARKRIRSAGTAIHTPTDISVSMRDFPTSPSVGKRRPTNISIKIDTTQEFATDAKQEYADLEKAETVSSSTRDIEAKEVESV
ncbi:hypothetical protein M413DRAFT_446993 [Hebeloma cylindrosporum]|uniref:DUF6534 domain-containing protein n=1 Tax=Hebeloma cylindrosporum TaxID=76867 RepID=A0A0C2XPC9_HEBCY|nr:hypothetical protein M413DRAFT_446993 [Hebeloma cylindrosporum h7]